MINLHFLLWSEIDIYRQVNELCDLNAATWCHCFYNMVYTAALNSRWVAYLFIINNTNTRGHAWNAFQKISSINAYVRKQTCRLNLGTERGGSGVWMRSHVGVTSVLLTWRTEFRMCSLRELFMSKSCVCSFCFSSRCFSKASFCCCFSSCKSQGRKSQKPERIFSAQPSGPTISFSVFIPSAPLTLL